MINFIYITTDLRNGKQYIGSHMGEEDDSYLGSGILISNAIKKHGRKNFKREILEECESIKEARLLEGKYISQYNTLFPEGYNISPDGGILIWESHTEKSKNKISKSLKGRTYEDIYGDKSDLMRKKRSQERRGAKFSKEWRKNLSESHKGQKISEKQRKRIGDFHRGKTVSQETADKIRRSKVGKKLLENIETKQRKFIHINELDEYFRNGWDLATKLKKK